MSERITAAEILRRWEIIRTQVDELFGEMLDHEHGREADVQIERGAIAANGAHRAIIDAIAELGSLEKVAQGPRFYYRATSHPAELGGIHAYRDLERDEVACHGCACEVPLEDGLHREETTISGQVYTYPCLLERK